MQGYLVKTQPASDLVQAIQDVIRGSFYVSPYVSRSVVEACLSEASPCKETPLTSRERQVLQLTAEGKTSKDIARILGLSARTAESHRARIMMKLDIHDTPGLVRYAVRQGMVEA